MAATIACCQETSAIADTMPTSVMPSDDANDGVNTAPVSPANPRKLAGSNLANSGSLDEVGAVDVVFGPHLRRGSSRARNRPLTYPEETAPPGKGSTATKSKKKSSKKSSKKKAAAVAKSPPLKVFARPAVSVLTVAAIAKVRAEKQRIEKEKKQKVRAEKQRIEKEKKQKAKLKSPTGPFYSKKKTGTDPSGSSECNKVAGSVPKERGGQKKKQEKVNNGKRKERSGINHDDDEDDDEVTKTASKKEISQEKSPNVDDAHPKKSKKRKGPTGDALLKTTSYMKPSFKPPLGELVDSSESSDDESVIAPKPSKKNNQKKKSPAVEARVTPKSKKSNSLSHVDIAKKTKDTKTPPPSSSELFFEDSASSDDASLASFKRTRDPENPLPIRMSLCNKQDKRKTEFTMVNDPQYTLFLGSFAKSLPMFKEPSSGLFLRTYFDPKQLKGCRFRCSNTKYPFDGRKERMVHPGKHICFAFSF